MKRKFLILKRFCNSLLILGAFFSANVCKGQRENFYDPCEISRLILLAQTTSPQAVPQKTPPPTQLVREVGPDELEFKGILLQKKKHRILFPGTLNQRDGLIEYVLVGEKGKTHESLLATKVQPHDIHMALLLIGLKQDTKDNPNETAPPSAIDSQYLQSAPKLKGAPVLLSVAWTQEGKRREVPVEDWILDLKTNHPMSRGLWTYNGSLIDENGVFLADQELSIVAVVTDPIALVNNPRQGYNDDQIWQVLKDAAPPLNTPVVISITLPTSKP
ncbi:MAG: YdjY domain-containing protein [Methylacidiphilales bacterium]|nr:YdjY domain-containing protein [Candidatus Methylacidiphilales bacterium]